MDHLINFVEKPSETFANLPVCPFAKQARTFGKIQCFVHSLVLTRAIDEQIELFKGQDHYETLWLIHPNCIINSQETDAISDDLARRYGPELQFFSGHPQSNFQMYGIYTRREPYPNIIVQKTSLLNRKERLLQNTRYYDKSK